MIDLTPLGETIQILVEYFIFPELYSDRMVNLSHPIGLVPDDFSKFMILKIISKDSTPYEGSGVFINFTALTNFSIENPIDNEDW